MIKCICIPINLYIIEILCKKGQYLLVMFMIKNMTRINFFNENENENDNDNDNENETEKENENENENKN